MLALLKTIILLKLPYDIKIEIFDKTVKPIPLYGSEIWGYGNCDIIEWVQLKFFKPIYRLKRSTPNHMIYGEIGIFPINIELIMLSFWAKLTENSKFDDLDMKLSSLIYVVIYNSYTQGNLKSDWISDVKRIWDTQEFLNAKWVSEAVKRKLKDQYIKNWTATLEMSSSSKNFRLFKHNFTCSHYINVLPDNLIRKF